MKKIMVLTLSLMLVTTLILSVPIAFAGSNNNNLPNGFQGTNKNSSQLPDQSNVPWPAGIVEDELTGPPYVVEGCRAGGETYPVYVEGFPFNPAPGGPCCPSNIIDEGTGYPLPNQCCNPPDALYLPEDYTPGNHCLCFVMRLFPQ